MPRKSKTQARQHWRRICRISGQTTQQSAHWFPSRLHRKPESDLARSCALFENEIRSAQSPPCLLQSTRQRRDKSNMAALNARLLQSVPSEAPVPEGEGGGVAPTRAPRQMTAGMSNMPKPVRYPPLRKR